MLKLSHFCYITTWIKNFYLKSLKNVNYIFYLDKKWQKMLKMFSKIWFVVRRTNQNTVISALVLSHIIFDKNAIFNLIFVIAISKITRRLEINQISIFGRIWPVWTVIFVAISDFWRCFWHFLRSFWGNKAEMIDQIFPGDNFWFDYF